MMCVRDTEGVFEGPVFLRQTVFRRRNFSMSVEFICVACIYVPIGPR